MPDFHEFKMLGCWACNDHQMSVLTRNFSAGFCPGASARATYIYLANCVGRSGYLPEVYPGHSARLQIHQSTEQL